jgi:hypothetical protein
MKHKGPWWDWYAFGMAVSSENKRAATVMQEKHCDAGQIFPNQ